jgi:hypothetical protein
MPVGLEYLSAVRACEAMATFLMEFLLPFLSLCVRGGEISSVFRYHSFVHTLDRHSCPLGDCPLFITPTLRTFTFQVASVLLIKRGKYKTVFVHAM